MSTTDYWGLARQGESGNGEDCALVAELAREVGGSRETVEVESVRKKIERMRRCR